ncbi:MAG: DUF465 domain-containing protein [Myxococcales bacterium]|nr:MAG: DUF465 domain-containing protein [Myxococcales bacterium]
MSETRVTSSETKDLLEMLKHEHARLEGRLDELKSCRYLTSSEYQRLAELKKLKLKTKDRIEFILRRAR